MLLLYHNMLRNILLSEVFCTLLLQPNPYYALQFFSSNYPYIPHINYHQLNFLKHMYSTYSYFKCSSPATLSRLARRARYHPPFASWRRRRAMSPIFESKRRQPGTYYISRGDYKQRSVWSHGEVQNFFGISFAIVIRML